MCRELNPLLGRKMSEIPEELRLDAGWSIGEAAFCELVADLEGLAPHNMVEFGSGASSVRLALAFPQAHILSIEHSPEFLEKTLALRFQYQLAERLQVELRPLGWQLHVGALYQSYRNGPFPESLDAVIIDGPPHWTRRGRETCLHMVVGQLRVGGRVYLDDYGRPNEQRIVRNWQAVYPNVFSTRVVEKDHGLCILEKEGLSGQPRVAPGVILDTSVQNFKRGVRRFRGLVRAARAESVRQLERWIRKRGRP